VRSAATILAAMSPIAWITPARRGDASDGATRLPVDDARSGRRTRAVGARSKMIVTEFLDQARGERRVLGEP
jgi:hypothetical protein